MQYQAEVETFTTATLDPIIVVSGPVDTNVFARDGQSWWDVFDVQVEGNALSFTHKNKKVKITLI